MDIKNTLKKLNLNDKEIGIYLALLPIGVSSASVLGKRTGIVRSTAQYTCQQLQRKGLISSIQKGNMLIYTAEPPEKLLYLLENQKRDIEQKEREVNKIIGDLKMMIHPETNLPKIQFFEGKEGIVTLYKKILDLQSPIDSFANKLNMISLLEDDALNFVKHRIEKNIFNRVICPADNKINKTSQKELRETRFIKTKDFPLTGDIRICKDQVNIFSFDKNIPIAISIQHKDIANNFRILFEYIWKISDNSN